MPQQCIKSCLDLNVYNAAVTDDASPRPPLAADEPRWQTYGCLALLLVGLYLALGPKIALSTWQVTATGNAAMDEALQWRKGTLALSHQFYESAESGGQYYNVVGLAFTVLAATLVSLSDLLTADPGGAGAGPAAGLSTAQYLALVALPLPLVAFWAFRAVTRSASWAAVMAAALIAGTSLAHVLAVCQTGSIYYINHVLAVIGLLIFGTEMLGKQRVLPALIGLILAAWSRQMTLLYALPLVWVAWRSSGIRDIVALGPRPASGQTSLTKDTKSTSPEAGVVSTTGAASVVAGTAEQELGRGGGQEGTAERELGRYGGTRKSAGGNGTSLSKRRRLLFAVIGIAIAVGVPMTLNALKFGNPLETGYQRLYAGRTDPIGRRAQSALFSLRYVPMHARAMNTAYPAWDIRAGTLFPDVSDANGGSIWLTSPLLLAVFTTARRWWADPARRVLMLGTLPVIAGLWCYHTTGANGAGCYRYALDIIPLWLLVVAPYCRGPRGLPLTLGCLAYSALYFNLLR